MNRKSLLLIFFTISLLLHLSAVLGFKFFSNSEAADQNQVLDLTLISTSKSPPTALKKIKASVRKKIAVPESATPLKTLAVSDSRPQDADSDLDSLLTENSESEVGAWDSLTRKPKVLKEIKAVYSEEAKAQGIEGSVVCEVIVSPQGKVSSVTIVKGLGAGLDEAAKKALTHFEFLPAQIGEKPVAVKIRYAYRFQLTHQ